MVFENRVKGYIIKLSIATMKKYRTFEGVANDSTKFNDVNVAIHNYIRYNILNSINILV
jgi:hypothetical protein